MNNYNSSRHTLRCFAQKTREIVPAAVDLSLIRQAVTRTQVIAVVEMVTGFTLKEMESASRKRPLVYARYCMMRFLRARTSMSLNEVGRLLCRDHATVIYGIEISDQLIKYDPVFKETYRKIEKLL